MDSIFQTESRTNFEKITQIILNNVYSTDEADLEAISVEAAKSEFKKMIFDCNFDIKKVCQTLNDKQWDRDKLEYFLSELEKRKIDLLFSTLTEHNASYGEILKDFDWTLKLIFGTSELKSLRYPLLQLILSTNNNRGKQKKMMYDLDKNVVQKMIETLESVDKL